MMATGLLGISSLNYSKGHNPHMRRSFLALIFFGILAACSGPNIDQSKSDQMVTISQSGWEKLAGGVSFSATTLSAQYYCRNSGHHG